MCVSRQERGWGLRLCRDPLLHSKCVQIFHTSQNVSGTEMEEAMDKLRSASEPADRCKVSGSKTELCM